MTRYVHKNRNRPWVWCVAIVAVSALVGAWNAQVPLVDRNPKPRPADPTAIEQIESTLAQAGCPGWMVLASEGEGALQPLPDVVTEVGSQTVVPASANVPAVKYPSPVRVANRLLFEPPPGDENDLLNGANDLLGGVDDLLAEPVDPNEEQPRAPEQPVQKTKEPSVLPGPASPTGSSDSLLLPGDDLLGPDLIKSPASPQPPPVRADSNQNNGAFPAPKPPSVPQPEQVSPPNPVAPMRPVEEPSARPSQRSPQQSPFSPPPQPTQPTPHSVGGASSTKAKKKEGESKTYCEYVAEQQYPSAQVCAKCHEKIFDEWSVSSHAYAGISPMFHKFEQKINDLSQGTVGYFCYRCHLPVGTTMGVSRAAPLWDLPQVVREGVTCVACHRVNQRYGKVNGHRRIEPGDIYAPVYGSIGGDGIAEVVAQKSKFKVKTSPHDKGPGQDIHAVGQRFDQLGKSEFCVSCHQVAVHPGIKLEVVWEQYRASPACKKGVSCQDCHMGRIPGVKSGYEYGAAAKVDGKVVNKNRKHANHLFYGPGYSIAHPGIFPHNIDANRWSMQEWLLFDWRAGWGTDEFEDLVDDGRIRVQFPEVWAEADDRYDAREIIEDNQKKLDYKRISRQQVLENGSHVDGPYFDSDLMCGQTLKFHYVMTNTNDGHNLPSGSLGAQPQLWANVVLIGPRGQRLWESGYTDRYGDVADIHSYDVRNKLIPFDWQLFNLQTMFLITGAKGTDREFFLPVNIDFDQLAYLRPGAQPITTINHPPFIRMEGRSLAPLGSRKIPYKVPAELMREPGHYRLSFRLRSRAEPIYFMRFCGSTQEMNRAMNEGMVDFHQSSIEFIVR